MSSPGQNFIQDLPSLGEALTQDLTSREQVFITLHKSYHFKQDEIRTDLRRDFQLWSTYQDVNLVPGCMQMGKISESSSAR